MVVFFFKIENKKENTNTKFLSQKVDEKWGPRSQLSKPTDARTRFNTFSFLRLYINFSLPIICHILILIKWIDYVANSSKRRPLVEVEKLVQTNDFRFFSFAAASFELEFLIWRVSIQSECLSTLKRSKQGSAQTMTFHRGASFCSPAVK